MKRFIFDLDGTLLTGSFESETNYFKEIFGEESNKINGNVLKFLDEYEHIYLKYDVKLLSDFLTKKSGLKFNENIINGWINLDYSSQDIIENDVIPVLEFLKSQDKSLSVLTNWFSYTQTKRLQRSGLISYFDEIYAGDISLKPHSLTYLAACRPYKEEETVIIGDNLEKDYLAPKKLGLNAILYDKNENHSTEFVKVKRLKDIKNIL